MVLVQISDEGSVFRILSQAVCSVYLCKIGLVPAIAGTEIGCYTSLSSISRRSFCCRSMTVLSSSIPVTARSVPSQVLRTIRDAQLTDSMMLQTDCGSSETLDTFFMMDS